MAENHKPLLRVLVVEDSEFDSQIMISLIRKSGYEVTSQRVEAADSYRAALISNPWDVILADYNLPNFSAPDALTILQETALDVPFIIVSGGIGEAVAVAAMKAGAHDYLMKGNLSRLAPAVTRELREAAIRRERREAIKALAESELRYRSLWEAAPDTVVLMDNSSTILFANPAMKAVFGYEPEEVIGQSIGLLQPSALSPTHRDAMRRYLDTGLKRMNWRATETVGRRKDGTEFPVEVSMSEMQLGGERRFVGFIRDITERKRTERELRDNQEQFRVAREIQQRLFPKAAPSIPGYEIAGVTHPAEATGGDYFDYLPMLNGRWGMVVADVTGHGVGPALLMAETRAYLRTLLSTVEDGGHILTRANQLLAEDVGQEYFVTLFLGCLEPATGQFDYASAGHPPGFVLNPAGEIKRQLRRTSVPLGIMAQTRFEMDRTTRLERGDLVLLMTDGIEEAMGPNNSLFGVERALEVVRENRHQPAGAILEALCEAVRRFSDNVPQLDDVTGLIIKVL
jgi:phosphoserine phosphatase RsbU/P